MTKAEFVQLWSIQFTAAYVADNYNRMATSGWKPDTETAVKRAILVEDAVMMAELAWEKFTELSPKYF